MANEYDDMYAYCKTMTDEQVRNIVRDEHDRANRYKGTDREQDTRETYHGARAVLRERGLVEED